MRIKLFVALFLLSATAHAQTIPIYDVTGGTIGFPADHVWSLSLTGPQFSFTGSTVGDTGRTILGCSHLESGETCLASGGVGGDFEGSGTAGGIAYPYLRLRGGGIGVSGPAFLIPNAINPVLTGPVTFDATGIFRAHDIHMPFVDLFGFRLASSTGTVTMGFNGPTHDDPRDNGEYFFAGGSFTVDDSAPTPEPGTLLSFAVGLLIAFMAPRMMKRRSPSSPI